MAQFFTKYTAQFEGKRIEIVRSKPRGSRDIIFFGKIIYNGRQPAPMEYRVLRLRGGGYKVFDVKLLGIWLTLQIRTCFVSVLSQNDGDFSALFHELKRD
jgi:phospholipid transport system substrate-binding protein